MQYYKERYTTDDKNTVKKIRLFTHILSLTGSELRGWIDWMKTNQVMSLLEHILPLLPGYAYLQNKDGQYITCTNSQALLWGLSTPKNIVNQTNATLPLVQKHPELINTLDSIYQRILKSKTALHFEELAFLAF